MMIDFLSIIEDYFMCKLVGYDMVKMVVDKVYEEVGVGLQDVQVCELYDCFMVNELFIYEFFGLMMEGMVE